MYFVNLEYKAKLIKAFSDNVHTYHSKAHIQKRVTASLLNILPALARPRILEIGCGTGILTKLLIRKYPDAIFEITDISGLMLRECEKHCDARNIKFFQMDGEKPFKNLGSYDLIVTSMTVHWFESPLTGIQRLSELGPLFYATIGKNNFREWQDIVNSYGDKNVTFPIYDLPGVIKEEYFKLECHDFHSFAKDLKSMGVLLKHKSQVSLNYEKLRKAVKMFNEKNEKLSWHIIYGKTT